MRGIFVTGTDTGVGKSVVAAAVCAALVARGERVAAFKPVVTGLDEEKGEWPHDHELLADQTGVPAKAVAPYRFGPPVSPHWASELAGEPVEPERLREVARSGGGILVCEGVGGLLVPLTPHYWVRDLVADLGLPLVVAARTGLGTINHTLLTLEAARAAGLRVAGVVMSPWPADPEPIELSNRQTIEALGDVPVSGLGPTTPRSLAPAGASLPIDDWLGQGAGL